MRAFQAMPVARASFCEHWRLGGGWYVDISLRRPPGLEAQWTGVLV